MSRRFRWSSSLGPRSKGASTGLLSAIAIVGALAGPAARPLRADAEPAESKPAVHKVTKGPFAVELTLEGVLEARTRHEVILRADQWTDFIVREAAAHGATVKKGDVLVACDPAKLQESIKELETTLKIAELSLEQARGEIQALEQSVPEDLAEAERAKKAADVNLKYFLETDREWTHRSTEFMVKAYNQMLENAQEELAQLEKMYKADDLTEGTEEIILKQQRFQVEATRFMVEQAKIAREKSRAVELPREEESLRETATQRTLALRRAERDLPLHLNMKRLELGKLKLEHGKDREKLAHLKHDLEAMTLRSPADGMVFYGACVHGQWPHAAEMAQKLRRGGSLATNEVIITVVSLDGGNFVRATIPEKELHDISVGLGGQFIPTAYPDAHYSAKIDAAPGLADPAGKFLATAAIEPAAGAPAVKLYPGMNGSLKTIVYKQAEALTVPAKSVFNDDNDDSQHYVYVHTDDHSVRRDVKIGRRNDSHVEILDGLKAGDAVLLKKPDDE